MEDFFDLCGGNDIIPVGEMTTMHQNNFVGESNPTRGRHTNTCVEKGEAEAEEHGAIGKQWSGREGSHTVQQELILWFFGGVGVCSLLPACNGGISVILPYTQHGCHGGDAQHSTGEWRICFAA